MYGGGRERARYFGGGKRCHNCNQFGHQVWSSLKGVLQSKHIAFKLRRGFAFLGNSNQSNEGIKGMEYRHVKYFQVRDCPEPVKAVKCPVCGGEGHRENR